MGLPLREEQAGEVKGRAVVRTLRPLRSCPLVAGACKTVCLRCGRHETARERLRSRACPGEGQMRRVAVKSALLQGAFDAAV